MYLQYLYIILAPAYMATKSLLTLRWTQWLQSLQDPWLQAGDKFMKKPREELLLLTNKLIRSSSVQFFSCSEMCCAFCNCLSSRLSKVRCDQLGGAAVEATSRAGGGEDLRISRHSLQKVKKCLRHSLPFSSIRPDKNNSGRLYCCINFVAQTVKKQPKVLPNRFSQLWF